MSDSTNDIGTFFVGFLIGGLVGAAVALLMAPQSGEETRVLIKDKGIELKDKAVESGQESLARAEKALEDARARADEAIVDLRSRTDELVSMTKEKAKDEQQGIPIPQDETGEGEANEAASGDAAAA